MNSKPSPWPLAKSVTFKGKKYIEEVIFNSKDVNGITILGDSPILLTNRMDPETNNCITIAKNINSGEIQTSYNVTRVIGQQKYNAVFTALLSVINPEIRLKGILALLTDQDKMEMKNVSTQTDLDSELQETISPNNLRKVRKRKMDPYVVVDEPDVKVKKENIKFEITQNDIDIVTLIRKNSTESVSEQSSNEDSVLPFDGISLGNISKYSFQLEVFNQLDNFIHNENNYIDNDKVDINEYHLNLNNKEYLKLPYKPEDVLHIATPNILKGLNKVDTMKLIQYQQYIDCILSMERDEDNCLPIHNAIVNNDMSVLWRHCLILKSLQGTVDVEIDEELTPLHLALQLPNMAAASLLLRHNADVIRCDASERCSLHHATKQEPEVVELLEMHCKKNARAILSQDPEIWNEELASKSDEELALFLGNLLGCKFDIHGYTPLMLAARAGWNDTVSAILSLSPASINLKSGIGGETALYLAVSTACLQSSNTDGKHKISSDYINTIKVLISQGADPKLQNHTGNSVLSILSTEFNRPEISLIVNSSKTIDLANLPEIKALSKCILVKSETGEIIMEPVKKLKVKKEATNNYNNTLHKRKESLPTNKNKLMIEKNYERNKQLSKVNKQSNVKIISNELIKKTL